LPLAACLETTGTPQTALLAGPPANSGRPDDTRVRLHAQCMEEAADPLRLDARISKQCDCYAAGVLKTMDKEARDFYATYGIVPTLAAVRPNDVKKQCGLAVNDGSGARGKLPPPSGS
jgi:hypothetical protein